MSIGFHYILYTVLYTAHHGQETHVHSRGVFGHVGQNLHTQSSSTGQLADIFAERDMRLLEQLFVMDTS